VPWAWLTFSNWNCLSSETRKISDVRLILFRYRAGAVDPRHLVDVFFLGAFKNISKFGFDKLVVSLLVYILFIFMSSIASVWQIYNKSGIYIFWNELRVVRFLVGKWLNASFSRGLRRTLRREWRSRNRIPSTYI